MYEISPAWMEYYRELEPEIRGQILERLLSTEPDDGSNLCRIKLYAQRYLAGDTRKPSLKSQKLSVDSQKPSVNSQMVSVDGKNSSVDSQNFSASSQKPSVDRYLWQCVNFSQLYDTSRLFKKGKRREVEEFLAEGGYTDAMGAGPNGERALYWEIRNAAKRFFKTCSGSEYRRSLFGLLSPGGEDQKKQMCLDTWKMTMGVGERLGISDSLSLWTKAVMDEYLAADPQAEERMRKVIAEHGRGVKQ